MKLPASSTEYVHATVTAPAGVDLNTLPVRMAVVAHRDNPASGEWHDAEWADGASRLLVGPDGGAITLTRGDYHVWVGVDPPGAENIVREADGLLLIT